MYSSSVLSGDYCSNAINDSNAQVEEKLNSSEGDAFKASFKGG